jgi:hypothetical protein
VVQAGATEKMKSGARNGSEGIIHNWFEISVAMGQGDREKLEGGKIERREVRGGEA